MQNSAFWTLHMVGCRDVLVDGIRILITPGMVELGGNEDGFNRAFGEQMADTELLLRSIADDYADDTDLFEVEPPENSEP